MPYNIQTDNSQIVLKLHLTLIKILLFILNNNKFFNVDNIKDN